MAGRRLTSSEHAAVLAASRLSVERQREFARDFDREVFDAWQGWTWGKHAFDLRLAYPDEPISSVRELCTLEAIDYVAYKRDPDRRSRRQVYRHKFDRPYARVVSSPAGAGAMARAAGVNASSFPVSALTARMVPKFKGPALFVLGTLRGVLGTTIDGHAIEWEAPRGLILAGCPVTHDMHVLRTGPARKSVSPIWIVRGRSPYRLTDAGIVR